MLTSLRETYCKITQSDLNHNENTSVAFTIINILQGCVGKIDVFKRIDTVGTSICCGSEDDMILNPIVDVLYDITHGSWNVREENHILLYLNVYNLCLYS